LDIEAKYRQANQSEGRKIVAFMPVLKAAQVYVANNFIEKERCYLYKAGNRILCLDFYFLPENFLHLCGLGYKQGGAKRFWHDLQRNHVIVSNLQVKSDGSTFQKLQILNLLPYLDQLDLTITGMGTYLHLNYQHAIRTRRELIALALVHDEAHYRPLSLLNLQGGKFRNDKQYPVVAIIECQSDGSKILIAGNKPLDAWEMYLC